MQCTHCNSNTHTDHQLHIVSLSIQTSVRSLKLAELMQNYYDCSQSINELCNTCNHPVKMHEEIVNARHVLVLQMEVWSTVNGEVLKWKTNITSIPDSSITVGSSKCTLMSAISLSSTTKPGCHYMAILSIKGKWMHFKGVSPSTAPWPRGGKDVLLLFYHNKSTVASTGKASLRTTVEESLVTPLQHSHIPFLPEHSLLGWLQVQPQQVHARKQQNIPQKQQHLPHQVPG